MQPRHRSSAAWLAWAYTALIAYASLYPFSGWSWPSGIPAHTVLRLPWPRWRDGFDIMANLVGYLPLGALVFGSLVRSGRRQLAAAAAALLAGAALSFTMEAAQSFLPRRVPSLLDWALNVGGAAIGAALAAVVHRLGLVDRWQAVRERWFISGSAAGLALLLLWPVGLLFPAPLPLGLGQVLDRLRQFTGRLLDGTTLEPWVQGWADGIPARAPLLPLTEMTAIALGLLAPCLVAYTVSHPGWRRAVLVAGAALLGFVTTTLSTALNFGPQNALTWLTPPALPAFALGMLVAALLVLVPRRAAAGIGLVVLTALLAIVAQAPADPYYADSLQSWEQGRFIHFHGAAQWVGWGWPYAAIVYLLARIGARD